MNRGIYIHVPFCVKKCAYCDFYSVGGTSPDARREYVGILIKHIKLSHAPQIVCDSIYFGGGTPSLLEACDIKSIINALKESFSVSCGCEITLEANPGTLDIKKLSELRSAGVNRLSLGVQSTNDDELRLMGRIHTCREALETVDSACRAGFDNISCDIIFGLPGQTAESLEKTADILCSLPISHISAYGLKIEEGTPFSEMELELPDEDTEEEMYFRLADALEKHGFEQYEISNFAKKGRLSRHNLKYWLGDEYIGFGPAAASYLNGERYTYCRNLEDYIRSITLGNEPAVSERYTVTPDERAREKVIFGLRLCRGISLSQNGISREALYTDPVTLRLINEGYMVCENDILRLTKKGFFISNGIINEILNIQG